MNPGAYLGEVLQRFRLTEEQELRLRLVANVAWDESKHPRHPAGSEQGGEFASKYGDVLELRGPIPDQYRKDEQDYHFHATNIDRAHDIATGGLKAHGPSFGTDQPEWPDGSRERRIYFGRADNVWQFAPEGGSPAALRVRRDATRFKRESTGDIYATKPIPASALEILTKDGWVPLSRSKRSYAAPPGTLDYAQLARDLDALEADALRAMIPAVEGMRDSFLEFVARALESSPQSPEWVNNISVEASPDLLLAFDAMFRRGFAFGRGRKTYASPPPNLGKLPESALRYFRAKTFWAAGLVSKDLTREAQAILLSAMKSGESANVTVRKLREAFGPFAGKLGDAPEQVGARLRTIVRTNTTDAYNQGALVEMRGREADGIVKAVEYVAILDDRTTALCEYLDGTWFRRDDPRLDAMNPPNHFNCRSVLSPVLYGQTGGRYLTSAKFRKAKGMIPPGFGGK